MGLSGRCPVAVTQCKPPVKAALNPLALLSAGFSHGGILFVEGTSRWFREYSDVSKAPAKYSRRAASGGRAVGCACVCL